MKYSDRINFEENFKLLASYAQFSHNKKKLNITDIIYDSQILIEKYVINNDPRKVSNKH